MKSTQLTAIDLLMHCAIKLNLSRIDAENAGITLNRNDVVYRYFRSKIIKPPKDAVGMVKTITKEARHSAYAFDQFFQLYVGCKPTLDCNPLGEKVVSGLKEQFNIDVEEIPYAVATAI